MPFARRHLGFLISLGLALGLRLPTAVPAAAGRPTADLPARIELPDGFQPEGIESDEAGVPRGYPRRAFVVHQGVEDDVSTTGE